MIYGVTTYERYFDESIGLYRSDLQWHFWVGLLFEIPWVACGDGYGTLTCMGCLSCVFSPCHFYLVGGYEVFGNFLAFYCIWGKKDRLASFVIFVENERPNS